MWGGAGEPKCRHSGREIRNITATKYLFRRPGKRNAGLRKLGLVTGKLVLELGVEGWNQELRFEEAKRGGIQEAGVGNHDWKTGQGNWKTG